MTYYVGTMPVGEHLSHHGIKGMRWGQRRYQNPDGSLTAAGRARYGNYMQRAAGARSLASQNRAASGRTKSRVMKSIYGINDRYYTSRANKLTAKANRVKSAGGRKSNSNRKRNLKRAAAIAGGVALAAGTVYLGKRYGKSAVRAAKRLGRAAPFKARSVGNKARTMYAKGVVNARHFGQSAKNSVRAGFGNVKRAAAKANFNSAMRKQAKATARANAASTLSRYGSVKNRFNRATAKASGAARKAAGATGDAFRGAGYHARRAGAKMKNAARNVGYKAGNAPYFMKRTAQRAGGAVKNAAKKAPGAAKKYYKKTHGTPAGAAYNAVMGAAYYGHARRGGASRKQAAAVGVTRAATGRILPAHAVGIGVRGYNNVKRAGGVKSANNVTKNYRSRKKKKSRK